MKETNQPNPEKSQLPKDTITVDPVVNQNTDKPDYYNSTGRKVGDFFIGCGSVALIIAIYYFISSSLSSSNSTFLPVLFGIFSYLVVILYIGAIIFFFVKNRRFISLGLLSILVVPFLFFGACLISLGTGSFK